MKIEVKEHDDKGSIHIIISTKENEFLGDLYLKKINDELLEVHAPVARPKYGKMLYKAAAMYAYTKNKFITSNREGDTREAAMKHWLNFFNDKYKCNKIKLEEEHTDGIDFTSDEDDPVYFHAYNMKDNDNFKKAYTDVKEFSTPKKILKEWEKYFGLSYEKNNSFIENEHPIKHRKELSLEEPEKLKRRNRMKRA